MNTKVTGASTYSSSIPLRKRGDHEYDTHRIYGQVYKRADRASEYDYVIVNGQLYWLDDEDLVQVGVVQTLQLDLVHDCSPSKRIPAKQALNIVPNTASYDV